MSELEPLPTELAELFAVERSAPVASTAVRVALRARLAPAVAGLPAKATLASLALGVTGKTIAVLALAIGFGSGTVAVVQQATRDEPVAAVISDPPVPVEIDEPARIEPARENAPPVQPRRARVMTPPAVQPSLSQAQLLKQAWASLSADAPAHALELARQDETTHPTGALTEERHALVVQALAKLQRATDARAAATEFVARYPHSLYRAQVERAVPPGELP